MTGEKYEDYVTAEILKPLDMQESFLEQMMQEPRRRYKGTRLGFYRRVRMMLRHITEILPQDIWFPITLCMLMVIAFVIAMLYVIHCILWYGRNRKKLVW